MNVTGVEGSAGTGKTYRVIALLNKRLVSQPILPGQKVLALTYMHGSRRRLISRLSAALETKTRFDCLTFDSLAYQIVKHWAALARHLAIEPGADFDDICNTAAALLGRQEVIAWIAHTYPLVLVDELQDLNHPRLAILRGLANGVEVIAAGDEFQCLDSALRPSPGVHWLRESCEIEQLQQPRRTSDASLLAAARDLRSGCAPRNGASVEINDGAGNLSPFHVARLLGTRQARSVAILSPSLTEYVATTIKRVTEKAIGKKKSFGPYQIEYEQNIEQRLKNVLRELPLADTVTADDLLTAFNGLEPGLMRRQALEWVRRQRSLRGDVSFARQEIHETLRRQIEIRQHFAPGKAARVQAMTLHQAKNREFEGVIILWPYQVTGDDEQRRRLLYNGVTRAQKWCGIITQSQALLKKPPFA